MTSASQSNLAQPPRPSTGAPADKPALTIILATPDNAASVCWVMGSFERQTAQDQIEILIVAPARSPLDFDESAYKGFFAVRVVEIGPFHTWAKAMVAGVHQAMADVVVLAEDHAFVPPTWAEALIAAHRRLPQIAAVGPAMATANPHTATSRVNQMMDYGLWLHPHPGGEMDDLPLHNSSYKKEALLKLDPKDFERMIDRDNALHRELKKRGEGMYLEPRAQCFHLSPSIRKVSILMRFRAGRLFGAGRAQAGHWPLWLRLLYVVASPLLPLMRLKYTIGCLRRSNLLHELLEPRLTAALISYTVVGAFGELIGYAIGVGKTVSLLDAFEFHRFRQMTAKDLIKGAVCGDGIIGFDEATARRAFPVTVSS